MQLIYRGFVTEYKSTSRTGQHLTTNAINWRYQLQGERPASTTTRRTVYAAPRAINWRWQYGAA
ncbi:MAG: hypothetical protein N5P05_004211 (plasmid) [Chroococcopsis gigantea SAG 12.99]|jgi:hypothetical protein|nr:hypothetical protein [Chroococcopsis gigantea SAG 12.99]